MRHLKGGFRLFSVAAAAILLALPGAVSAGNRSIVMLAKPKALSEFSLTDSSGRAFTAADLKHRWTVLYNGEAQCAVVCPKALRFMAALQEKFATDEAPRMVLVTNAHGLNSPAQVRRYVKGFNPELTGATGQAGEVGKLEDVLRRAQPGTRAGAKDPVLALINPDGEVVAYVPAALDNEAAVAEVTELLTPASASPTRFAR